MGWIDRMRGYRGGGCGCDCGGQSVLVPPVGVSAIVWVKSADQSGMTDGVQYDVTTTLTDGSTSTQEVVIPTAEGTQGVGIAAVDVSAQQIDG